jgi:CMP-N,N'-diacetyllegionaminic acid synthase
MKTYAIIAARAGSKGLPGKNIKPLNGVPLMAYSIAFAKKINVDRIICSTDSEDYADIARKHGAEVPFLRSSEAAGDKAMEEHVLADLYDKFDQYKIDIPDLIVWLRPTFVFRSVEIVNRCIQRMQDDSDLTSCRTVCDAESRLYVDDNGILKPIFDDKGGRSMIRRQELPTAYKVFSTDVIRANKRDCSPYFLGNRVGYEVIPKICGFDIDDEFDWNFVETIISSDFSSVSSFVHV